MNIIATIDYSGVALVGFIVGEVVVRCVNALADARFRSAIEAGKYWRGRYEEMARILKPANPYKTEMGGP
jgi:hypothetical protein